MIVAEILAQRVKSIEEKNSSEEMMESFDY
jgi:hypothetical protein